MRELKKEYVLGDMRLWYVTDEEEHMGFALAPKDAGFSDVKEQMGPLDGMVQVKLTGDVYRGAYAPGNTLSEGESTKNLRFVKQECKETEAKTVIETLLRDERGYEAIHKVTWKKDTAYLRVVTQYRNASEAPITLELLSSFAVQGMTYFLEEDGHEELVLHRLRSRWSEEGKLVSERFEDLQLNPSWALAGLRNERFGSIGSMPVNHYFPFAAVEDCVNGIFWGAQVATPSSWQMEVFRESKSVTLCGGIADRDFGHWTKTLAPGETLETPEAIVSVARTDSIDAFTNRLVSAGKESRGKRPQSEENLPIIFNEYCTTWGNPSHENIAGILEAIRGHGCSYFVIDCGWFKETGVPWDISMGDYLPSAELFPEGIEKTVEMIKKEGYEAGIWFEVENVGCASKAFHNVDHLLKLDGQVLTTTRRRFWDLKDSWVQKYLDERVIGTLKTYGFTYIKTDYNDAIGIGVDGIESKGEELRTTMLESYRFFEKMKQEIPELIIEACASGGHRLEPGFMERSSMASFSDAHECREIPLVAANVHRAILPEQSQIWAVIREQDSKKRIAYSLINTFLGRMCLSGDVTNLSGEQWEVIDKGIAFYKEIVPIIRDGQSYITQQDIKYLHNPEGWQSVVRVGENGEAYVTIHVFGGELPEKICIELPKEAPQTIAKIYSAEDVTVEVKDGVLSYRPTETDQAIAILLR